MFPWQAWPLPVNDAACSKHSFPVNEAARPEASTIPACRVSRLSSSDSSRSRVDWGSSPSAKRSSPRGPNVASAKDWVATAPSPPRAHGTTAPTARNFDCVATPTSLASGSAATMENVMNTGSAGRGMRT